MRATQSRYGSPVLGGAGGAHPGRGRLNGPLLHIPDDFAAASVVNESVVGVDDTSHPASIATTATAATPLFTISGYQWKPLDENRTR